VTRRALAALTATVALTGCGTGEDATKVVERTADRLGAVRSGDLELRVLAAPGDKPGRGVGFELDGPFSLGGDKPLPVTRIRFTRVRGQKETSAVLTSTGDAAFVTTGERTTRLPPSVAKDLSLGERGSGKGRSLAQLGLRVDRWIADPELEEGPTLGGVETDRVTGRLRAGRAVRDVLTAIRGGGAGTGAGAGVTGSTDKLVDAIDDAVKSSRAELITGRKDGILRRLDVSIDLRPARELDQAIPGVGAVRLTARLALRKPNRRVRVSAPG
jgi:hypothetical protein